MRKEYKFKYEGFNYYCQTENSKNNMCNPIVVLSGAFQSINSWDRYLEHYTKLSSVILVDLPGTGKSDILPNSYSLDFLASSLHDLFQNIGLEKAEIVAVSYGTPIGIIFSEKYPNLVSHLALVGTMRKFPDETIKQAEDTFIRIDLNEMDKFAYEALNIIMNFEKKKQVKKFDVVWRVLSNILEKIDDNGKQKYIENTKRLIYYNEKAHKFSFNAPVLVFTGEHDSFTRPEYCREIAASFRNSVFTTIQESDHLCNLQQFHITNNLISNFLLDNDLNLIKGCNKIETNSS